MLGLTSSLMTWAVGWSAPSAGSPMIKTREKWLIGQMAVLSFRWTLQTGELGREKYNVLHLGWNKLNPVRSGGQLAGKAPLLEVLLDNKMTISQQCTLAARKGQKHSGL